MLAAIICARPYYIRVGGSGDGTGPDLNSAFGSVADAFNLWNGQKNSKVAPGDTVWIAPGTYQEANLGGMSGNSEASRIVLKGDINAEHFSDLSPGEVKIGRFQFFSTKYFNIENLSIGPMNGDALYGFVVAHSHAIIIKHNKVQGMNKPAVLCENFSGITSTEIIVDGNILIDNSAGVMVAHGSGDCMDGLVIRNNIMINKTGIWQDAGIMLTNAPNTKIFNNTVIGGKNAGALVVRSGSPNVLAKNNIFVARSGMVADVSGGGFLGDYNLFYHKTGGSIGKWNGSLKQSLSDWQSSSGGDINSITADPKFIDEANFNFTLDSSSSAINAGETLAEVPYDLKGVSRPQGVAYDIGAYEYDGVMDTTPVDLSLGESIVPQFKIYPNPIQNHVSIETGESGVLNIHSLSGQLMTSIRLSSGVPFVWILKDRKKGRFTNGIFLLSLVTDKTIVKHRIIVR